MFLSFGNPTPYAKGNTDTGVPLICQIQTLADAKHAVDCCASVIIAQGPEAGGHGESRATMTLVPEVADMLAGHAPDVLLCAAGGIADGLGLAAASWISRHLDWPERYTARVLKNSFTERWHNDIAGPVANANVEVGKWQTAWAAGDMDITNTFFGESTAMIDAVLPAG